MVLAPIGSIQVSGLEEVGEDLPSTSLSSPSPLDPSLVAFLRSRSRTHEQAEEKAIEEQRAGGPSVEVSGEEPIMPTSVNEPRQEDKPEPGTPGLEEGGHLLGNKSRGKNSFWRMRKENRLCP